MNYQDNYKANQLIPEYIDFFNNQLNPCKTILTINLTFNDFYKTSVNQAKKDGLHFKNLLDHNLYGKRKGKLINKTKGFLIVEGNDYDPLAIKTHIHGILGFDLESSRLCKFHVQNHWAKLKRAGMVTEIKEWDGDNKWISYILKQSTKSESFADLMIL